MSAHRLSPSKRGPWHLLIGPYYGGLVRALKSKIPPAGRQWDPKLKAWRIGNEYVEIVQRELDNVDAMDDAMRDYP